MTVLERIRADMGRWEGVRAEVLHGVQPEVPADQPKPLSPRLREYRSALTRVIEHEPGLTPAEIAERVGRRYGSVKDRLLQWDDPETGPFHRHRQRAVQDFPPTRFFPGPCSATCPGRPSAG